MTFIDVSEVRPSRRALLIKLPPNRPTPAEMLSRDPGVGLLTQNQKREAGYCPPLNITEL
jgi:hypothetical protein